jgi:hypothetical protein
MLCLFAARSLSLFRISPICIIVVVSPSRSSLLVSFEMLDVQPFVIIPPVGTLESLAHTIRITSHL